MDRKHFVALDSLRGICATLVVLYHFDGSTYLRILPFIENGFLFVDFFFVLSGFVIAASYGSKLSAGFSLKKFTILRLGRLYPLHFAMLLAYLAPFAAKMFASDESQLTGVGFFVSALLLQAWTPGGPNMGHAWNPPSWSISAEFWTYCLFAVICRFAARWSIAVHIALIIVSVPILVFASDRYLFVTDSGAAVVRCIFGFSFGVLTYAIRRRGYFDLSKFKKWQGSVIEVAMTGACLAFVGYAGAGPYGLACPLIFAIAVLIFSFERGVVSDLLLTKPLVLIGTLSYSIYMTHEFILARLINLIKVASRYIELPVALDTARPFSLLSAPGWQFGSEIAAVLYCAIVVAVSWLAYRCIEAPMREKSRMLAGRISNSQNVVAKNATATAV